MKHSRLHYLFQKYIFQKCTVDEETEFMDIIAKSSSKEEREELINECFDTLPEAYTLNDEDADRIFKEIIGKPVRRLNTRFQNRNTILRWVSLAAAVALVFITVTIILFRNDRPVNEINQVVEIAKPIEKPLYKNDIKPGGNKAILTLADGTKIVLDDASQGALTKQGNTTVIKLDDGRLAYNPQHVTKLNSKAVFYNTLTTPRGGQYCVTLPDGTIVWLNASSSLHFPTAFTGNERKVEVVGEAYFEVAKNAEMPFYVKAGNSEIKVLGTHFNITAYADDKIIKTTLLEGSVQVSMVNSAASEIDNNTVTLQPGQQFQLDRNNTWNVIDADLEEAVAWKNGFFIFNNENLESIMLKISRWYDVKVVYEVSSENKNFTGHISRSQNVSEVLSMLELTESLHFKIDGKTITILP